MDFSRSESFCGCWCFTVCLWHEADVCMFSEACQCVLWVCVCESKKQIKIEGEREVKELWIILSKHIPTTTTQPCTFWILLFPAVSLRMCKCMSDPQDDREGNSISALSPPWLRTGYGIYSSNKSHSNTFSFPFFSLRLLFLQDVLGSGHPCWHKPQYFWLFFSFLFSFLFRCLECFGKTECNGALMVVCFS